MTTENHSRLCCIIMYVKLGLWTMGFHAVIDDIGSTAYVMKTEFKVFSLHIPAL